MCELMTYRKLKKTTYLGLILLDFLGILLAFMLAFLLRHYIHDDNYYLPEYEYSIISIILGVFYVLILHSAGTQKRHPFGSWQVEVWAISSGIFKGTVLFMALAFLYREFSISRLIVFFHLVLAISIVSLIRLLWRLVIIQPSLRKGVKKRILAIVPSDENQSDIADNVGHSQIVITKRFQSEQDINKLESLITEKAIDGIEVAERGFPSETILKIALTASRLGLDLRIKPDLPGLLPLNFTLEEIDGELFWTAGRGLRELYPRTLKRIIDILLSTTLLILFFIPGLVFILLIGIGSRGGVFYNQERIGRKGHGFKLLKFRTMYKDATERLKKEPKLYDEFLKGFKLKIDPRITPIGNFLRRYSLDELPQLINILIGEMSFVGPRPVVQEELERYGELKDLLMSVPPGLTGLWQVSGRSDLTYDERVRLDLYYVENWSLSLDSQIIVRTLPAVLFSRGAY
ncbi:exopolysaccharide biosynthesis polyprenyl glycosylphosphotransferase [bacterium]|nr:exopolysaccharide biosynthesis polyprenyl glycosylphosphotransferase [bacterium]